MADPLTYNQLLENSREIDELLQSPELNEEEKEDLEYIWNSLKSREESKFDAIISLIKDCDKQILIRDKEITELKRNQTYWKNKRKKIINIIKKAYEEHLIDSMPKKISDNSTVNWKEETLPDKKAVRDSLEAADGKAPRDAHLSRKFSLTYNLRKRLRIGI